MLQQSMVLFLVQLAFTLIREERGFKRICFQNCFHLYAVVFIFPRRGRVGFGFGFGLDFCFFCFVVFVLRKKKKEFQL